MWAYEENELEDSSTLSVYFLFLNLRLGFFKLCNLTGSFFLGDIIFSYDVFDDRNWL